MVYSFRFEDIWWSLSWWLHLVQMFAGQQASTNTSCWPAVVVYLDSEGFSYFGLLGFVSCASYDLCSVSV